MGEKKLFALRGAAQALNDQDDIQKQVIELYEELLSRNTLDEKDIVSAIFSITKDLNAKNPATALRNEGKAEKTALFVTQEPNFPDSLERVIRLLIHCYLDVSREPSHVYRNGAEALRPDLQKAVENQR
jgi:chorismate mutase